MWNERTDAGGKKRKKGKRNGGGKVLKLFFCLLQKSTNRPSQIPLRGYGCRQGAHQLHVSSSSVASPKTPLRDKTDPRKVLLASQMSPRKSQNSTQMLLATLEEADARGTRGRRRHRRSQSLNTNYRLRTSCNVRVKQFKSIQNNTVQDNTG